MIQRHLLAHPSLQDFLQKGSLMREGPKAEVAKYRLPVMVLLLYHPDDRVAGSSGSAGARAERKEGAVWLAE